MNATLNRKEALFYFLPTFIAFLLPFGNALTSPVIAVWFVVSFFNLKTLFRKEGFKHPFLWISWLYFGLTLLSNYFYFNPKDPFSAVEVKLSFLFFPFLFFLFRYDSDIFRRLIAAFISGCMFASLFCIGRGVYFSVLGDSSYLYYSKFSFFMHSAYFAMYLNLAILLVAIFYFKWFKEDQFYKKFAFALIGLFAVASILCASKIGLITLFTITLGFVIIEYRKQIKPKYYLIGLASIALFCSIIYLTIPEIFIRLKSVAVIADTNIDKTATESSSVRVLIWKECRELISEHLFTGVGVSNTNETLYAAYAKNGLTGALDKKLNAHNQYFQTWIGLGLIGFILMLALTIGQSIYGFLKKNKLLIYFGLLISINFLVESMLQTAAGTVFVVYFLCLFMLYEEFENV